MRYLIEESLSYPPKHWLQIAARAGGETMAGSAPEPFDRFFRGALGFFSRKGVDLLSLSRAEASEAIFDLYRCTQWARYGFNVFQLSHSLAAALLLTEPPPFVGELKTPFPTFAVLLPSGAIPFYLEGRDQQLWSDTLWWHRYHTITTDGKLDPRETTVWTVLCRGVQLWHRHASDSLLDDFDDAVLAEPRPGSLDFLPQDQIPIRLAARLVRNLVAWLDATKPECPTRSRSSKSNRGDVSSAWPNVWVLGNEVKLSRELRDAAKEYALGHTKHAVDGWKVRQRFIVRGHWRNQSCGPGRTERRLQWIAPFWKGPEGAAAWSHLYTDAESREK